MLAGVPVHRVGEFEAKRLGGPHEEREGKMQRPSGGLWHDADFIKLWAGETVSLLGSQVTLLAIPLLAAVTLEATPLQMGTLGTLQYIPWLLAGLPAGAWVDRLRRRPIMIAADLGRALLL